MTSEIVKVTIFHTNDMHARLGAMARLSSYCRALRSEAEAEAEQSRVEFWDAGDAADRRTRICSLTKGAAFAPILNAMGYTLQTMGNAISLPYGPQAMSEVAERARFPILAANCRDGSGPLIKGLQEYALIPLPGGITMGVIGMTAPWGTLYELFGLRFPDFISLTQSLVNRLKEQGVAPICLLSHLGMEDDRRLVDKVEGIDLIVGGHSHERFPSGVEINGVLVAQAGQFAEALGRVELELDGRTGQVLSRSATVLDVPEGTPEDEDVLTAIDIAEEEIEVVTAEPIGVLQAELELDHFQECRIGNFTADAVRARMDADIAIIASGQFHQGLPEGTTTIGLLDAACFSSANPGVTEVTGAQVLQALERGLDPNISRYKHHGFRGTVFGIPQISGLTVEYDPEAAVGKQIGRVLVGDQALEPERVYRLAHTDAEVGDEHGYLQLKEGQEAAYEVPTIVREVMEDYIRQRSPAPVPELGRWCVVVPMKG